MSSLLSRGISLPVIAVMIGLILFVLALIFAIIGRTNNRPPTMTQARKEAPKSVYEDELQRKINSLKAQPFPPTVIMPAPEVKISGEMPATAPAPLATPAPSSTLAPSSSMMDRLKDRGVLESMPQATQVQRPPESV